MFWTVFLAIIAAAFALWLLSFPIEWWLEQRSYRREMKQFVEIMSKPGWTTAENEAFVRHVKLSLQPRFNVAIAWGIIGAIIIVGLIAAR